MLRKMLVTVFAIFIIYSVGSNIIGAKQRDQELYAAPVDYGVDDNRNEIHYEINTDAIDDKLSSLKDTASSKLSEVKSWGEDLIKDSEVLQKTGESTSVDFSGDYDRDAFGKSWKDVDRNGCDTRNDILSRDLINSVINQDCKVQTGELIDPYSGEYIYFERGKSKVDIDHIVPLKYAWENGAAQWTNEKREEFANDPSNLLAVSMSENRAKGASGPSDWLPSSSSIHCEYAQSFKNVADAYGLSLPTQDSKLIKDLCK